MIPQSALALLGDELVATIADENRASGIIYADFPRLTARGFERRVKAVTQGRGKGAVIFPSVIKQFVRREFPVFSFSGTTGDLHRFESRPTKEFKSLLLFEKIHHFGLGKAYTVHVGFEQASIWRAYSLFRFFDRGRLEWTYGTRDDLDACLRETASLLRLVLPSYARECSRYLESGTSAILSDAPNHGGLSFREAARIAANRLGATVLDFPVITGAWQQPSNAASIPPGIVWPQTERNYSGRLAEGQCWRVRFANPYTYRSVIVEVPYRGRLKFAVSDQISVNRSGAHQLMQASIPADVPFGLPERVASGPGIVEAEIPEMRFADSSDVMAIAEAAGGGDFLHDHPASSLVLTLDAEISEPPLNEEHWWVQYEAPVNKGTPAQIAFRISAHPPAKIVWRSE